ncbi:MAG: HAD-IB family hydrolase, partial [Gammaproteobacteria bacterium]|nr:HAD-IB family hydrolase [Gammaproteobacteria bacterium]
MSLNTVLPSLAIFDLDNTLIGGDSDYLWGEFLVERGVVDAQTYHRENERYYELYQQGNLDILEYLKFALEPLAKNPLNMLNQWRKEFIMQKIEPIMLEKAAQLIARHKSQGDQLMIITATNRFITEPIAQRLGIDTLIATEAECVNNSYTGRVLGIPCFQEGKVKRLHQWLQDHQASLEGSWFYSDSHNDLPLLELVSNPVVVDPDEILAKVARERGWA